MNALRPLEAGERYRCAACGNLTRFDVETIERVRRYWHVDLGGEGDEEDVEKLSVEVVSVACRWCNSTEAVQIEPAPGTEAEEAAEDGEGAGAPLAEGAVQASHPDDEDVSGEPGAGDGTDAG